MEQDERRRGAEGTEPEGHQPVHDGDGVDPTLIRWLLAMPPGARLATLERTVRSILRLRNARVIT
jgi:hypothetical protein